jgi:predicted ATPase
MAGRFLSQATRDLVDEANLRNLGEHRLKDLSAAERIYQLGGDEHPPLKSLNATNLPVAASPLVGRRRELDELLRLLRDGVRLVTLIGPGGTGKTRLGLQVAAELVERFAGGVFFVPLAGVAESALVGSTIASTVGVRDLGELRDREALVFVDNFEHLVDAAPVIAPLIDGAAKTKVLATSRSPLRLAGEHEYLVDPLPDQDAVELLIERASAVRADFAPGPEAVEICRRLDGLPLAVELAASRLRSLGPEALLQRLDKRLPLLTGGRRHAPERQRTLRATIEWSYELLEPDLQQVFARLAVFSTFSLEAAEAVTDGRLDDVDALTEASLLKPIEPDRFLMLETIRELAAERLEATGGANEMRRRHLRFFGEVAERANLTIEAEGPMRHDLVIPEHNNVRAALAWAISAGEGELGLRLALALENFWVTVGSTEGIRWVEALLPMAPAPPHPIHAGAVRSLGNCYSLIGDNELGERFYEESLAEYRFLGDELRMGVGLDRLAGRLLDRDTARARRLLDEALESHRRSGFKKGEAVSLSLLAWIERQGGARERALDLYDRSLALAQETGFTWWEKNTLLDKSEILFALGQSERARGSAAEALELSRRIGDRSGVIYGLALIARGDIEDGAEERAGCIWAAVEAELARVPLPGWDEEDELIKPVLTHSGPAFEAGRAAGRTLSLDEAVDLALGS